MAEQTVTGPGGPFYVVRPVLTEHGRLAVEMADLAAASGAYDFMRDDPMCDDYEEDEQ